MRLSGAARAVKLCPMVAQGPRSTGEPFTVLVRMHWAAARRHPRRPVPSRNPAGSGTVAAGELLQPLDHGGNAAISSVGEGAAAEGCEPRTKNDRRIDEIGIFRDALAQTRGALVDEYENQPVDEVPRRRLRGGRRGLDGLAVLPEIKTRAGLAAELLQSDELAQPREIRGGTPEIGGDDLAHMRGNIEAYDVGELDRAHWHAEGHRRFVDGRDRDTLLCRVHGFVQVGHQHAVDNEP